MYLKNIVGHFMVITRHKWVVFKLCCKVGQPWRGLVHDLSKYSPTEFWEGVKYFNGKHSPITDAKKDKGYSQAWLHHKGRNKHHTDYWVDLSAPDKTPIIPYQYVAEMLCDKLAAGMVYKGKDWTKEYELDYWLNERDKTLVNDQVEALITEFLTQVSKDGIDKVLTKKNVKALYKKYCSPERRNEVTREYANKE
ncbi:uncharacterized protein BN670_00324 [Clostridium sp. CAG:470]|jgi:hypothetical protein|nr:uncharacterized protein BN670_00324 [Clostridium sp. CAG:470]